MEDPSQPLYDREQVWELHEVSAFARTLGVSDAAVIVAIGRVGNRVQDLRADLQRAPGAVPEIAEIDAEPIRRRWFWDPLTKLT